MLFTNIKIQGKVVILLIKSKVESGYDTLFVD